MVINRYELPPSQEIMETIVAEMGYAVEFIEETEPLPDAVIYGDTTYINSRKSKIFTYNGDHWVYTHMYAVLFLSSVRTITDDELGKMLLAFFEKIPLKDPSQDPMEHPARNFAAADDISELTLMSQ